MQVAKWSKIFMNSLFDQINQQYDDNLLEGLFKAYFDARKNKRNKYSSLDFEFNFESNLIKLYKSIKNGTYKPLPSIAFISTRDIVTSIMILLLYILVFSYILNDKSKSCVLRKTIDAYKKKIEETRKPTVFNDITEDEVIKAKETLRRYEVQKKINGELGDILYL